MRLFWYFYLFFYFILCMFRTLWLMKLLTTYIKVFCSLVSRQLWNQFMIHWWNTKRLLKSTRKSSIFCLIVSFIIFISRKLWTFKWFMILFFFWCFGSNTNLTLIFNFLCMSNERIYSFLRINFIWRSNLLLK